MALSKLAKRSKQETLLRIKKANLDPPNETKTKLKKDETDLKITFKILHNNVYNLMAFLVGG